MLILLLVAGVIIIMILANRRHVQQEVKIAQMQVEYEKELRIVENEVQEQVLTNVARELHDNIGQLLTLIRLQLEQEKLDNEEIAQKLAPVDNTLSDTIDQVRLLSHSLNTDYLETQGLNYAIEKEANRLSQLRRLKVHWTTDGIEPSFDKGKRIMIFRMLQEVLNNALKHATAKNIHITMRGGNSFMLEIKDDGRGFDKEQVLASGKGSGLHNLQKRAKLAGVSLNITAATGKGSIFTFSES
ncbi:MAG TPA: sensor histidine kinase [Flavipsychrobacter sp.]